MKVIFSVKVEKLSFQPPHHNLTIVQWPISAQCLIFFHHHLWKRYCHQMSHGGAVKFFLAYVGILSQQGGRVSPIPTFFLNEIIHEKSKCLEKCKINIILYSFVCFRRPNFQGGDLDEIVKKTDCNYNLASFGVKMVPRS